MILIDTHIWIWWANNSPQLTSRHKKALVLNRDTGLGVSVYSCWEVAMLISRGRLTVNVPPKEWISAGLALPGVQLVDLTPDIAIESSFLPGTFHKDPADQILVATARVMNVPILTQDGKIRSYPHVRVL